MAHFIACNKVDDATTIAKLIYYTEVVILHGVPKTLVSDKDGKFLSYFQNTLWRMLGTKLLFFTSHHPQIDAQTEVTHKTLGSRLRTLVSKNCRDWDLKLHQTEFAYNRSSNCTTKNSPFECVCGSNPLLPISLLDLYVQLQKQREAKQQATDFLKLH